jgi:H/ACA ribonucleoprotein complex subunit 2
MDVISHLPVLCEDHSVPYMYVTSRADLGAASNTKRPTSVVMVRREKMKKVEPVDEEKEHDYQETYSDLVKLVQKAGRNVKV